MTNANNCRYNNKNAKEKQATKNMPINTLITCTNGKKSKYMRSNASSLAKFCVVLNSANLISAHRRRPNTHSL